MDLYIYYRVRSDDAVALRAKVEALQRRLSNEYGVLAGLKRRPQEKEGRQTWMETYLSTPSGFEAALDDAVARADLAALIDGPRHTEHFVDVSSCA